MTTELSLKTPRDVRDYLRHAIPQCVKETIAQCHSKIAEERYVFAAYGQTEFDRQQHESIIKPWLDLIGEIERDIDHVMLEQIAGGQWIGFGYRHPDGEIEVIPTRYWPFLTLNIDDAAAAGDGMAYRGIRFLDPKQIPHGHGILRRIETANKLPSAGRTNTVTPEKVRFAPNISQAALERFVRNRTATLLVGDPGLTQKSLIDACRTQFGPELSGRRIIAAIKRVVPAEKQFRRGHNPKYA